MTFVDAQEYRDPPPPPALLGVARNLLVNVIYFLCGSVFCRFEKEELDGSFCKFIVDEVTSQ